MEPVTTTAAATVAAPAAAAATPEAGGAAAPAAGATPGASAGISPAYGAKLGANPLDSVASRPSSSLDPSSFQRVLGCHDSASFGANRGAEETEDGGQVSSSLVWKFDQGGTLRIDPHTPAADGATTLKIDRAPDPFEHSSASRALQQREEIPSGRTLPEPSPSIRAQSAPADVSSAGPGTPIGPQSTPNARADSNSAAGQPARVKQEPTPERRAQSDRPDRAKPPADKTPVAPLLTGKGAAVAEGMVAGFGNWADTMFDLSIAFNLGTIPAEEMERAKDEFREFDDNALHAAEDQDEEVGEATAGISSIVPDLISPESDLVAEVGSEVVKGAVKKGRSIFRRVVGRALLEAVEKTKAYKALEEASILAKKPLQKNRGTPFQFKVSKGKQYEYEGVLKKGVKKPDGKIGKTVQIDELRIAEDDRLILVEAKFENPLTEIHRSVNKTFWDEKLDLIKRYARFAEENPKAVSHVEIVCSGDWEKDTSMVAEVYLNIWTHLSPAERELVIVTVH